MLNREYGSRHLGQGLGDHFYFYLGQGLGKKITRRQSKPVVDCRYVGKYESNVPSVCRITDPIKYHLRQSYYNNDVAILVVISSVVGFRIFLILLVCVVGSKLKTLVVIDGTKTVCVVPCVCVFDVDGEGSPVGSPEGSCDGLDGVFDGVFEEGPVVKLDGDTVSEQNCT